ncbi:MAG: redoxin domain-containing protein [Candidatus Eisenbacteria bacterium]|uniref:Redoxin domain-containing protein n=1 Tax=Eiseniibacteriota bacterium TaxID=2212470 RepID=A0A538SKB6_UNCEI|nr:MAG: redoxin domain-containing protein [Candidatus Eisenbacteria bacterium]
MRMLLSLGAAILIVAAAPPGRRPQAATTGPDSGAELIGRPAPRWTFDRWIGTEPMTLEKLRGKVVLLRWWTEGCHFCSTTLPVVDRLRKADQASGLVVIGVFHPKPPHPVSDKHILAVARRIGFSGPIAVDGTWSTLDRYWLDGHPERDWTSVSFLIDREGVIRWVHGGGEYHPSRDPAHARCDLEYRDLEKALSAALAEQGQGTRRGAG